jgi:hypothetical protein
MVQSSLHGGGHSAAVDRHGFINRRVLQVMIMPVKVRSGATLHDYVF